MSPIFLTMRHPLYPERKLLKGYAITFRDCNDVGIFSTDFPVITFSDRDWAVSGVENYNLGDKEITVNIEKTNCTDTDDNWRNCLCSNYDSENDDIGWDFSAKFVVQNNGERGGKDYGLYLYCPDIEPSPLDPNDFEMKVDVGNETVSFYPFEDYGDQCRCDLFGSDCMYFQ
jgi:hypothetical protein